MTKINSKKFLLGIFLMTNSVTSQIKDTIIQTKIDSTNLKKNLTDIEKYEKKCSGIIIIGSGPAGLTAALYAARLGIPAPLILAGPLPGGLLTTTGLVENWPGSLSIQGTSIAESQIKQAEEAGAQMRYETVLRIDTTEWPFRVITDQNTYYGFTIVVATGSKIKKLGCKGENEFWGKGVSSCAICDAPAHKNKTVIVVGGGDSACEETLQLIPHVAHVYIIVRKQNMRASMAMQNKVKNNEKVTILYNTEIKEIKGNKDGIYDAVLIKNSQEELLFSDINKHPTLSGVFLAIGHTPATHFLPSDIKLDENGLIETQHQRTSTEGVFAAGDVCNTYRQACVASGEGCIAALESFYILEHNHINLDFADQYSYLWVKKQTCINGVCLLEGNQKLSTAGIQAASTNINPNPKVTNTQNKNDLIVLKNKSEFQALAKKHKNIAYVIQVATAYCPPCKVMKKTLTTYKKTIENSIPAYVIEIEDMPLLSQDFGIRGFPTLLLFYGDKLISKKTGSMSIEQFTNWIDYELKKFKK